AQPPNGSTVRAGSKFRIFGAAWGGRVKDVEVSVDGCSSWQRATLLDQSRGAAWCRWEIEWAVPWRPGEQTLMARAVDEDGRTQPVQRDPDLGTYMIHHLLPVK